MDAIDQFWNAVEDGDVRTVRRLVGNGIDVNNVFDEDGFTPLTLASYYGKTDTVKCLADLKAAIDKPDKDGQTALMLASEKGHKETVRYLVQSGATVDKAANDGWTALMRASYIGHKQTVRYLLESGATVDKQSNKGFTALMLASQNGHKETVVCLVDFKATVNMHSKDGFTALMLASQNGHKETVVCLVDFKATVNMHNKDGFTALMLASQNGHKETVVCLVDFKATVNMHNKQGATALMMAAQNGHKDTVKYLIDSNARLDFQLNRGNTSLHVASLNGHTDIVKLLTESNAKIDLKNKLGKTAVDLAKEKNHGDIITLLSDLDLKAVTDKEKTPGRSTQSIDSGRRSIGAEKSIEKQTETAVLSKGNSTSRNTKDHTPAEILAQGPDALHAYRNAIQNGKKAVFRTRVMFVGQERVGKTSLKKKLMGEKFDSLEISTDGVEASSQCRIDIHQTTTSWTVDPHTRDQHDAYTSAIVEQMAKDLKKGKNADDEEDESDQNDDDNSNDDHTDDQPQSKTLESTYLAATPMDRDEGNTDITEQQHTEMLSKEDNGQAMSGAKKNSEEDIKQSLLDSNEKRKSTQESKVPDDVSKALSDKLDDEDGDQNDNGITFSLWDFAGQELYYTTHQVFLSRRTVFIVVFNLEDDFTEAIEKKDIQSSLDRLEFWLQSIYTFTYDKLTHTTQDHDCDQLSPPIFIVGTHRNSLGTTKEERQRQVKIKFDLIRELIDGKPYEEHVVPEYFDVDNSQDEDERIFDLKRKLMQVMEQEPYMGEEIPLRWLKFEDSVKDSVIEEHNTMTIDKVKKLPGASGVESQTELTTMLTFYHELGAIMYHPSANHSLKELVILNPHWLIDVFRRVITVLDHKERRGKDSKSWTRLEKEGILEDKLISSMWKEFIGNDEQSTTKKTALLELMEMYDLLVEQCLPKKKQHQKTRCYYVPSRLKKTDNDTVDETSDDSPSKVEFFVDFNGFLPVGFFHRMLTRAVQWSQNQGGFCPRLLYNKATFFADNNHNFQIEKMANMTSIMKITIYPVEIEEDEADSKVSRDVDKNTFHKVRNFLAATLEELKNTWARGITYAICFECPCKKGSLHFLDLDKYLTEKAGIQFCTYHTRVRNNHFDKQFSSQCSEARNIDQGKTGVDELNRVKRILTRSIRIICDHLHSKELLRIMVSEEALTADDMTRIQEKGIASDQAESMLTILMKKPIHSYDVFMKALLEIERTDIYESIKKIEKEIENSI